MKTWVKILIGYLLLSIISTTSIITTTVIIETKPELAEQIQNGGFSVRDTMNKHNYSFSDKLITVALITSFAIFVICGFMLISPLVIIVF